ncbi:GntR family transcriptional regulator [Bosea sp. BK604]|uniref:GntR family transcriptional regulator n=1 Tax=Bosea sp. BK604 TaxID=2512180 RepID=UPI001404F0CB|nr:GntR family transcriptional regulator [Bosea sp. BK604]
MARARAESKEASLNASVYDRIKAEILTNRLRPGVKLTHQGIAELLGVSRTPVREALERLLQEGYVFRLPRRGFFVGETSDDDTRDYYQTREALELYQLERLFERGVTEDDLRQLRTINERYSTLITQNLTYERMLVDRDFHLALAGLTGNAYLVSMLNGIFERLILKRRIAGMSDTRGLAVYEDHLALLGALEKGQESKARKILAQHIRGARERLLSHLRQFAPSTLRP